MARFLTIVQLKSAGIVRNPNMWIGNGWIYCAGCERYTYHDAYSHEGQSDCYEVCCECNKYCGTSKVEVSGAG